MDYYSILGVSKDATLKEIKKNFNELSSRYHPDRNPNDRYSEEKMKIITMAYTTLSDYDKRINYDSKIDGTYNNNSIITPFKPNGLIQSFDRSFESSFQPLLLMNKINENDSSSFSKSVQTSSIIKNGIKETTEITTENGKTNIKKYKGPIKNKGKQIHTFF